MIGIVREDKIDATGDWIARYGYVLYDTGSYFYTSGSSYTFKSIDASGFKPGDTITVKVDLDANKISFKKNGQDNGMPQNIARGSYYFAFDSNKCGDDAVTIVERK